MEEEDDCLDDSVEETLPWIVHMILPEEGQTGGWVHSHGLNQLGLPELEVRDVQPAFLLWDAGRMINRIGEYMMRTGNVVKAGETMAFGENGPVLKFHTSVPILGEEDHFLSPRLLVTAAEMKCSCCHPETEPPSDGEFH